MKIKWKGPLLAFALAFGAVAATPALDGAAQAVDFNKACTLTVQPGGGEFASDLAEANIVIDLYKIADAVPVDGYDTYTYSFVEGYAGLKLDDHPDNAQWEALAQSAAGIAFGGGAPVISGAKAGSRINVPGCGLYLTVARGEGIQDYVTTVKSGNGDGKTATIAYSGKYAYTFMPSLVSLPSKEADADGTVSTAGDGDWLYDLNVTLKPERSERYGSLEIVKTLQSYETKDPATFVFDVEAKAGGKVVYSNVVSLSFTAPGQKTALVEKLPVGAEVTVKEVYSGAVYALTTEAEQTVAIEANRTVSVAFVNDYTTTDKGGGAVVNHFDYDATNENGWGWTKETDGK